MRGLVAVLVLLVWVMAPAAAQEGLYDRPVLVLDPGVHTASIRRADVDAAGQIAVTGSLDRTVRLWSVAEGRLVRTIRVPIGSGNVGKVYAVAISPDGRTVAAGGWLATEEQPEHIYLLDVQTGALTGRIGGLPNVVLHLAFSPDGRRLVATLGGANGIRVFAAEPGWPQLARDIEYGSDSYDAAFAPDGRLATTSYDGRLRLYDPDGVMLRAVDTGFARPYGVAFDPAGDRIAVGFADAPEVRLFDGRTLAPLPAPDTGGIDNGSLSNVAWSADGEALYAAGTYVTGDSSHVVAWADGGAGPWRTLPAGLNTVMSPRPLPDGDLLVAAQDPWLGRLAPDGTPRWVQAPAQMDARDQHSTVSVSADGTVVEFGFDQWGRRPARFDLGTLTLSPDPPADDRTAPPVQTGLPIDDWINNRRPTLAGHPLPLRPFETSRSLAIHPDGDRFALGTIWNLFAFDAEGQVLWDRDAPGVVWAVNITGDGRFAVAAYGDGTIRWHRMADGTELLALFPFTDGENWVVWEPDGRFAATPGARRHLFWHRNRGWDQAPITVPAQAISNSYRPGVIKRILPLGGTALAVFAEEEAQRRREIQDKLAAPVGPGAQLHALTVGISDYGHGALTLDWADDDARDLSLALEAQADSGWPYQPGHMRTLRDAQASKDGILAQLEEIRLRMMAAGPGQTDLAVIHFAGHGAVVGQGTTREFYLLPHGVTGTLDHQIEASGLSATLLRRRVAQLAEHGRVLLLLDACRSGAGDLAHDADLLRRSLDMTNVTVLTSSTADQDAREDALWENGAFTEALLEAFTGPADGNANGMISMGELADHLSRRVPELARQVGHSQTPGISSRFSGDLFASQL